MSIGSDLLSAWPGLLAVGAGVGLLLVGGRDPKANQHDLSDCHEPAEVNAPPASLRRYEALDSQRIPATMRVRYDFDIRPDILPPAPSGMDAGSPLYAETLFESWRRETPADTAGRFLREIGQSERAKAGIRPITSPATDRDYTGSFPVVRAA